MYLHTFLQLTQKSFILISVVTFRYANFFKTILDLTVCSYSIHTSHSISNSSRQYEINHTTFSINSYSYTVNSIKNGHFGTQGSVLIEGIMLSRINLTLHVADRVGTVKGYTPEQTSV